MRGKGEAEHERDIGFSGLLGCFFLFSIGTFLVLKYTNRKCMIL